MPETSSKTETTESTPESRIVPLRRQYQQIKARFPDTVLFFRLGDFYETFEEDAFVTSSVLDIVLTSREMGKGTRVPMAGIPHHAAEGYIARLIAAGHKVAVCEQVGEVTKGKGIVDRDVTRVVTPGTVTEPSMLQGSRNNYLVALLLDEKRAGIAYADVSTGEFSATELVAATAAALQQAVSRELGRLDPAEIVLPSSERDELSLVALIPDGVTRSPVDLRFWKIDRAASALRGHFGVESLDGFGLSHGSLAIGAAGGLLEYLGETQGPNLRQITSMSTYSVDGFMTLDAQTRRNLELTESTRGEKQHSLIAVLDRTQTPMGGRLLRRWLSQPLLDQAALDGRLDRVDEFHQDAGLRTEMRNALRQVGDIERMTNRAIARSASPREMAHLRDSLRVLPDIRSILAPTTVGAALPDLADVAALLEQALVDEPPVSMGKGPTIRPGFAPELDGHRARAKEAREWIASLERTERERTGIKSLKVGYNKVFGYYLEITTAALATAEREKAVVGLDEPALPEEYIPKQSLTNATRYFTPKLKEFETIVLNAEDVLDELELDTYRRVLSEVAGAAPRLLEAAAVLAEADVLSTFAHVAVEHAYVRPEIDESGRIEIVRGRHPTLENVLGPGQFVPNDASLDVDSDQIVILTGPNMAGKSSWLRQVALITLMSQIGSFVPAERARIGLVDRIFTRIGAQDDIATGQSTFMVEMLETANILNHATSRSLVVLDEIGRGTSTWDGLAIARAIVEHLHNAPALGCKTLFATHYHELTELEEILPRVRNYRMDVLEEGDQVVFLRQVVPGGADRSYGIHVAGLAGIPKAVVRRAEEVLSRLEQQDQTSGRRSARREAVTSESTIDRTQEIQLTMFGGLDPVTEELRALDIDSLTPLEAITKLFELRHIALDGNG